MAKYFEDQKYENVILLQRVELIFSPAKNWQTCTMPMTTDEMVAKVFEELGMYFDGNSSLVIKIMEDLHVRYEFNEFNTKMYWLINPA